MFLLNRMSRLGVKVTAIALIALAITFGIFLLIYEVAVPEFLYGESNTEWQHHQSDCDPKSLYSNLGQQAIVHCVHNLILPLSL